MYIYTCIHTYIHLHMYAHTPPPTPPPTPMIHIRFLWKAWIMEAGILKGCDNIDRDQLSPLPKIWATICLRTPYWCQVPGCYEVLKNLFPANVFALPALEIMLLCDKISRWEKSSLLRHGENNTDYGEKEELFGVLSRFLIEGGWFPALSRNNR